MLVLSDILTRCQTHKKHNCMSDTKKISIALDAAPAVILVVDDEESIRKTLKYMLSKEGYTVLTAEHASIAYEILDKNSIDLVISDIVMPDISGLSLVKYINKQYQPPQILLITGEPSLETATSAVKLGVFDYISKPVKKRALLDVVHQAIEKKSLLDEKERLVQQNLRYLQDLEEKLDQRTYRLLITEEKYRSLFENTNVGIGISAASGEIIEVNPVLSRLIGLSTENRKNYSIAESWVEESRRSKFIQKLDLNGNVEQFEAEFYRLNGSKYWASVTAKKIKYRDEDAVLTTILDISKRKQDEIQLKQALDDKEEMLREIHHRTKNNMNVIISLLNMQMYSSDNKELKEILKKVNDRIFSMSLVHEQIYLSREFSSIDLPKYINSLIMRHYAGPNTMSESVKIETKYDPVKIGLSQAIPTGLVLNELIANAINHAFKDGGEGTITVQLKQSKVGEVDILVMDDGLGFPKRINLINPSTLGLHMVKILVEDQLNGTLEISSEQGATVHIRFKVESPDRQENDHAGSPS